MSGISIVKLIKDYCEMTKRKERKLRAEMQMRIGEYEELLRVVSNLSYVPMEFLNDMIRLKGRIAEIASLLGEDKFNVLKFLKDNKITAEL